MVERPTLHIEAKGAAPFRLGPAVRGAMVLEGERHGRKVSVRVPYGGARSASEVELLVPAPEFEFKARDGRLKAGKGAPDAGGCGAEGGAELDQVERREGAVATPTG